MLHVKNLSIDFHTDDGVVNAVKNLDLSIDSGQIRGLVGESGSGKSVTAMAIIDLIGSPRAKIRTGEIYFNGRDLLKMSPKDRVRLRGQAIGLVSQNALSALDPSFTVASQMIEVIRRHRRMSKKDAYSQALDSLELVGMPDPEQKLRAYPHQLSGGQRQRVVIAIALSAEPDLLLADEPTTALDATVQKQILDLLLDINKELGTAILMVTHDFGVVSHMCESVTVMRKGVVLEDGIADEVLQNPQHLYTQSLIKAVPRLHVDEQLRGVPRSDRRLHVFEEALR